MGAIAQFIGQSWNQSFLTHFQRKCGLRVNVPVAKQIGPNNEAQCKGFWGDIFCGEALLDVEYIKAVAGDIPLTAISVSEYSLLKWTKILDGLEDLPLVNSLSYGTSEA